MTLMVFERRYVCALLMGVMSTVNCSVQLSNFAQPFSSHAFLCNSRSSYIDHFYKSELIHCLEQCAKVVHEHNEGEIVVLSNVTQSSLLEIKEWAGSEVSRVLVRNFPQQGILCSS